MKPVSMKLVKMVWTSIVNFLILAMKFFAAMNSLLSYLESVSFGYSKGLLLSYSNFLTRTVRLGHS